MTDLSDACAKVDALRKLGPVQNLLVDRFYESFVEQPWAPPPTWSGLECIAEYADAAATELMKWANWHEGRAEKRDLPKQWGLEAIKIAAWNIYEDLSYGADDARIEKSEEALHRVITNTKYLGWTKPVLFEAGSPEHIVRDDQALEVDESFLRGWARVLCSMAECFKFAREDPAQARRWCHEAAHELAFCCPPKNEDEDQ